jgi:hypothetical protein
MLCSPAAMSGHINASLRTADARHIRAAVRPDDVHSAHSSSASHNPGSCTVAWLRIPHGVTIPIEAGYKKTPRGRLGADADPNWNGSGDQADVPIA